MTVRDTDIYVGVDAGGSHTEAVITSRALEVLARETGPAGAIAVDTADRAADHIERTVRRAVAHADCAPAARALVVGAAGAGSAEASAALRTALLRSALAPIVEVTTDAAIAYASVHGDEPGMLLIAGSGSIALARDVNGSERRAGGRGWQHGDAGSGYAIGRAALAAVERAAAETGPPTTLSDAVASATNMDPGPALSAWAHTAQPAEIASLARGTQAAAAAGDRVAVQIVEEAARALVDLVIELVPPAPIPLALWGGVLSPGSPARRIVTELLAAAAPTVSLTGAVPDPALGAAALALRLTPPDETR